MLYVDVSLLLLLLELYSRKFKLVRVHGTVLYS